MNSTRRCMRRVEYRILFRFVQETVEQFAEVVPGFVRDDGFLNVVFEGAGTFGDISFSKKGIKAGKSRIDVGKGKDGHIGLDAFQHVGCPPIFRKDECIASYFGKPTNDRIGIIRAAAEIPSRQEGDSFYTEQVLECHEVAVRRHSLNEHDSFFRVHDYVIFSCQSLLYGQEGIRVS